jgi:hypothetical protein
MRSSDALESLGENNHGRNERDRTCGSEEIGHQ